MSTDLPKKLDKNNINKKIKYTLKSLHEIEHFLCKVNKIQKGMSFFNFFK